MEEGIASRSEIKPSPHVRSSFNILVDILYWLIARQPAEGNETAALLQGRFNVWPTQTVLLAAGNVDRKLQLLVYVYMQLFRFPYSCCRSVSA